jgi:hypothetical protein
MPPQQMTQEELDGALKERFRQLPKAIQNAITSADVQKELQALSDTHKLHVDQWQLLENTVMLTLLGFQPIDELAKNLKNDLTIPTEKSEELAEAISKIVFEPIREQLERELDNPQAKEAQVSDVEKVGQQVLAAERTENSEQARANSEQRTANSGNTVMPATPPAPAPDGKAVRAPVSEAYRAGESSTERKSVHDDPYREAP